MNLMPWEKEGDTFIAEVAKKLILNLRDDKEKFQAQNYKYIKNSQKLAAERDEALSKIFRAKRRSLAGTVS